jgi:hypothetical protein
MRIYTDTTVSKDQNAVMIYQRCGYGRYYSTEEGN